MHADTATTTARGWHLRAGDNAGARGQLSLYLVGLAGGSVIALPGADFTGDLGVHAVAIAVLSDGSIRYSWDGGAVQTIAAPSGTYVPPSSGDPMRVGVSCTSIPSYPSESVQPIAFGAWSSALSDADLAAVSAGAASAELADASVPPVLAIDAWRLLGCETAPDAANAAVRWRIVGPLNQQGVQ